ncbi:MAG TPA: RHS repeat-associated core domain-containing protein, partial [Acidobacteriota bacterium]|nr:RHS repeat-associated core domain-containing protein [Acidobacteriota bacterium]
TRLVLDRDGYIQSRMDYEPYGIELYPLAANTSGEKYKFTNQERDYTTGLDYFHARYYSSAMGRFMGPDPINGNPANPQSWNLYIYAGNNPVSRTDPMGLYWQEAVHMLLTQYLAMSIGFSEERAKTIAKADWLIDEEFGATPFNFGYYHQHFMSSSEAWGGIMGAGSDEELGLCLHPLQDIDAHDRLLVFWPIGHFFYGTWVDNPSNDPKAAYNMIVATVVAMGGDPSKLDWVTIQRLITTCKTEEELANAIVKEIGKLKQGSANDPEHPSDPPCPGIDPQGQQDSGDDNGTNERRLYVGDMRGGR